MRSSRLTSLPLILAFGLVCALPAAAQLRMDGPADDGAVMHLGQVEVHGQKAITKTLQAIKVALTMPYSNDPKLANVMVCRMEDEAGSHIKQELVCGTNRTLALRRGVLQSNLTVALSQNSPGTDCASSACYTAVFEQLSETIRSLPGNYLDQTVNGPALRKALNDTPMPTPDAAPAVAPPAAPVLAPAAASGPHTI